MEIASWAINMVKRAIIGVKRASNVFKRAIIGVKRKTNPWRYIKRRQYICLLNSYNNYSQIYKAQNRPLVTELFSVETINN